MNGQFSRLINVSALAVALLGTAHRLGADDKPKDKPASLSPSSPAEQYQSLLKEFEKARQDYFKASEAAKTDEERATLKFPDTQQYADRLFELAEKYPSDPAAVDAFVWVVIYFRSGPPFEKAMGIVREKHLLSDKLAQLCDILGFAEPKGARSILREILSKNPHREVQGHARFSLAQLAKEPDFAEAEKYFNQVIENHGELKHSYRAGTLGDLAKGELFEHYNLSAGKVAPDIEGEDVDGQKFKLSDFRGKIALVDFWGDW